MIVGLPKEVKNNEHRVGLTPNSVKEITDMVMKYLLKIIVEKKLGSRMKYMRLLERIYLTQLQKFMESLS